MTSPTRAANHEKKVYSETGNSVGDKTAEQMEERRLMTDRTESEKSPVRVVQLASESDD